MGVASTAFLIYRCGDRWHAYSVLFGGVFLLGRAPGLISSRVSWYHPFCCYNIHSHSQAMHFSGLNTCLVYPTRHPLGVQIISEDKQV